MAICSSRSAALKPELGASHYELHFSGCPIFGPHLEKTIELGMPPLCNVARLWGVVRIHRIAVVSSSRPTLRVVGGLQVLGRRRVASV
jgi:hypothetical protein